MRHFALLALSGILAATPAFANIGRIKTADAGVMIQRGATKIEAKPGVTLEAGDVITTPDKGKVGITFVDNSRVSAGSGSIFAIETFEFDDTTQEGRFVINLSKGRVAVVSGLISRGSAKGMLIKTPKSLFALRDAKMVVRAK